jgi:hypothetical protein
MMKKFLIASLFLFAAAAPAANPGKGEPGCTTQCTGIKDTDSCASISECFWDVDDKRCESRYCSPGPCGLLSDTATCNGNAACFWDPDDKRCESRQ